MRRPIRSLVVGAAAAALATIGIATPAHAETSAPVLDSVARLSPVTIGAGAAVSVRLQAHDSGGSHFAHWTVTYQGPNGGSLDVQGGGVSTDDVIDQTSETTLSVWAAPGSYQAVALELRDWAGNARTITRAELPGRTALPPLDFSVTNAHPDVTAPTLSDLGLSSTTVVAGDTLALTYRAYDTDSGIASVYATFVADEGAGAEQRPIVVRTAPDAELAAAGPAAGAVSVSAPGGRYHLDQVHVTDRAGNATIYLTTWTMVHPPGLTPPGRLDLSALTVDVQQPGAGDAVAPELVSVSLLSPAVLHPYERAVIAFDTKDVGSGVDQVMVVLEDDEGHQESVVLTCGNRVSGRVGVYPPTAMGRWHLVQVGLVDAIGNSTYYRLGQVPEASTGETPTAVDLSRVSFSYAPGAPREGPEVPDCPVPEVTVTPDATYVTPGTTVTLSGEVRLPDTGASGARVVASGNAAAGKVRSPLVAVYGRAAGRTALLGLTRGSTQGTFARRMTVQRSTSFRVWFPGSGQVAGGDSAVSATANVYVGATRTLKVARTRVFVKPGGSARLVVKATPTGHRETVHLYRDWPSAKRIATLTLNRRGKAHQVVKFSWTTRKYHWRIAYAGGFLPARSSKVVVRPRP